MTSMIFFQQALMFVPWIANIYFSVPNIFVNSIDLNSEEEPYCGIF